MSVIKAGTTLTTAYTVEADTTGALEFKTGPSATLAMSISASGVVTFPATTGFDIASANITNLTSGTTSATVLRSASGTITNLLATTLTISGVGVFPAGTVSAPAITTSGDSNTGIYFPAADTIAFSEGGVEAARFDSSGNLNIGTTGYGNYSTLRKNISLGVGTNINAATSGIDPNLTLVANGYLDSTPAYKYIVGDPASYYEQYRGAHYWAIAASGTPGNTISFTQAMTLDASSRLMIGGTTAESKLNVYSGGSTFSSGTMPAGMTIYGATTDGQGSMLSFKATSGDQGIAGIAGVRSSGYQTELRFYTNSTNSQNAFAERVRITAAGDVGIGTTSPAYKLDVNGGISLNAKSLIGTSGYFICGTNGFRWNNSTDAFNNVIMYDNGTTQFRNAISLGGITPTTSGVGVQFPATQSASSDANTLDDYEEGEFTPQYFGTVSNPTVTYTRQTGRYVKIGRMVYCGVAIIVNTTSGGSGILYFNAPFTAASTTGNPWGGAVLWNGSGSFNTNQPVNVAVIGNTANVYMHYMNSTNGTFDNSPGDLANSCNLEAIFMYEV